MSDRESRGIAARRGGKRQPGLGVRDMRRSRGVDRFSRAGGLCQGYDGIKSFDGTGKPILGGRTVNEIEAETLRREFAAGASPRAVARRLNGENIPGPVGRRWTDSTIRGHAKRGTGLLNNELYIGRLVWNRQRSIKNPETGKRVSRINPPEEWIAAEVPELRIVVDGLWQAVKHRLGEIRAQYATVIEATRSARAHRLNTIHRHLLSGLLACGVCGGPCSMRGQDRRGCSNHIMTGTCSNVRGIRRAVIKERALSGLKDRLMAPEAAAEALDHPEDRDAAVSAIRGLMERIALTPSEKWAEMGAAQHGGLGTILEWAGNGREKAKTDIPMSEMSVLVVARAGNPLLAVQRHRAALANRIRSPQRSGMPHRHPAIQELLLHRSGTTQRDLLHEARCCVHEIHSCR